MRCIWMEWTISLHVILDSAPGTPSPQMRHKRPDRQYDDYVQRPLPTYDRGQ